MNIIVTPCVYRSEKESEPDKGIALIDGDTSKILVILDRNFNKLSNVWHYVPLYTEGVLPISL